MTDQKNESVLKASDLGSSIPTELKDSSFLFVSREGFERTPINFGGKVFLDALPIEFEISVNMGIWQYDGAINYLDLAAMKDAENPTTALYAKESVTIEKIGGVSFFGVEKTPYGKFQTDFTIKKTIKKIPVIKPSFGAGASAHFATPVLSKELVSRALNLGPDLSTIDPATLSSPENVKKILTEITDGAKKPKVGMHIVAGIQVKPPVIPLGLYVDGKYLIMFEQVEKSVGIKTGGFLVNAGIMFAL